MMNMSECYMCIERCYVGNKLIELLKKDGVKITNRTIKMVDEFLGMQLNFTEEKILSLYKKVKKRVEKYG